jgi:hypothetical protein
VERNLFPKERKRTKKKEMGGLMETDAAVDKISDLQLLSTAAWKSPLAFHTVPSGPAAITSTTGVGQMR